MSTPETPNGHASLTPRLCEQCESPLGHGRFCPGCGHAVTAEPRIARHGDTAPSGPIQDPFVAPDAPTSAWAAHGPVAESAATDRAGAAPPPPGGTKPRGSNAGRRWMPIAIAAGALVVVAGTLALLLGGSESNSSSQSADAGYRAKLANAIAPVMRDNQQLSDQLARLRDTKATDAKADVRRARQTTTLAQGATGALRAPAGSQQLSVATAQLLDREAAYLSAVSAVLSNPSSSAASEVRALQSDLTSAIIAAGPLESDQARSVSGADSLTTWAAHTRRVLRTRARAHVARQTSTRTGSSNAATPAPPPSSGMTACDQNISAQNDTTSCSFAMNVFWGYWLHTSRGDGTTFSAWNPSSSRLLAVSCSGTAPVTCTTNTNSLVTFPIGAVNAYTQRAADAYAASHDLGPDPYS